MLKTKVKRMSLKPFPTITQNSLIPSLLDVVKQMNTYEKVHMSQVIKLFKLILVLPATNASSERSFGLMLLVKSYLRATTSQG